MKVEDVEDDTVNGHVKQKQKEEYKYEEDSNEKENDGKEEKKKDVKPTETVGLFELFKFADKLDVFLIIIGIISAIACGSIFSVMYVMFGDVTDVLAQYNAAEGPGSGNDAFLEGMNRFARNISFVGFGILITHYIFVAAFNYSAERQAEL